MPSEGIQLMNYNNILNYKEIVEVVKVGVSLGITKIRLTGGEPLVRKNISELIGMINDIKDIEDIGLTTNGILLPFLAKELKKAGLQRVNISLDTINPDKYKVLTRYGNLEEVFLGIEAAKNAGLAPIKINCVLIPGINDEDKLQVKEFCRKNNLQFRLIRQMNIETGEFYPVDGGAGGVCSICNRLRLTANGFLVPCLHSSQKFNIHEYGIKEAFLKALNAKPLHGVGTKSHQFCNIGG
jgi:cyclic pyranopterin phosphate synthase